MYLFIVCVFESESMHSLVRAHVWKSEVSLSVHHVGRTQILRLSCKCLTQGSILLDPKAVLLMSPFTA